MPTLHLGINTLTTIINKIVNVSLGIFITRILVTELSTSDYGFFVFIWSISSALFFADLGMGIAAQKKTSEYFINKDDKSLSDEINTISVTYFFFFCLFTLLNYLVITPNLDSFLIIEVEPHLVEKYKSYFFICTSIIGFNFAISFYREIIHGMNKIYITEFCSILFNIFYFILILAFQKYDLGLEFLMYVVPGHQMLSFLLYIVLAYVLIPGLKFNPFSFNLKILKKVLKFSLHVYTQAIISIVQKNVNHIIIGGYFGTITVALYQFANKIQEIMKLLNEFYQTNVMPTTTKLFKSNLHKELKTFILNSNRLIFFTGTCSFFIFFTQSDVLLWVWLKVDSPVVSITAKILIFDVYLRSILNSVNIKYLIMSGEEKPATKYAVIELCMNVGLSLLVIRSHGIIGMAVVKVFSTFVVQFFGIQRMAINKMNSSLKEYWSYCYTKTILISIPPLLYLYYVRADTIATDWTVLKFIYTSIIYGFIFLIFGALFVLTKEDKIKIIKKFPKVKKIFPSWEMGKEQ